MTSVRAVLASDRAGLVVAVLLLGGVLSVLAPSFTSQFNIYVLLRDMAVTLLVAFSQLVLLAIGQLSVAVGAMGGLVAVFIGSLLESWDVPIPLAVTAGLALGATMGVVNGVLVVRTGINSFVVTLGMASVYTGINLSLTGATPYSNLPPDFVSIGQAKIGPAPIIVVPAIVAAIALAVFFREMLAGRRLLAVGGNARAAEVAGINAGHAVIFAHALSGLIAAVAATVLMLRLGAAQPTIGSEWLLPSFAGPIIGGTALEGGAVTIAGTVLGSLLIVMMQSGMVFLQVDPFWAQFLLGFLILAAVAVGRVSRLFRSDSGSGLVISRLLGRRVAARPTSAAEERTE